MNAEHDGPFTCAEHVSGGKALSYLDSRGAKSCLHFLHANGFPVSVYLPLLEDLARDYRVTALSLRGQDALGEGIRSWHEPARDLAGFLDDVVGQPVLAVGHSIGAVATMLCAARRPDLFHGLVLLDPVLLNRELVAAIRVLRGLGLKRFAPLARRARRRRNGWRDRQEALAYFRSKPLFGGWNEAFLRAYVTYGLRPAENGGFALLCPPEAEAMAFENYPTDIWTWPGRLRAPALFVRGAASEVLREEALDRVRRLCRLAEKATVPDAGHLFPMQQPAGTARLIRDFHASIQQGKAPAG